MQHCGATEMASLLYASNNNKQKEKIPLISHQ